MTCTAKVENGIIRLPENIKLPDGMEVQIIALEELRESRSEQARSQMISRAMARMEKGYALGGKPLTGIFFVSNVPEFLSPNFYVAMIQDFNCIYIMSA